MARKSDPIGPGELLREEFLKPLDLSQNKRALAMGVEPRRISEFVNGHRFITVDTAMRIRPYLKTGSGIRAEPSARNFAVPLSRSKHGR